MTFLITQASPLYCHFAFSDLNIFSGTCSRVVYIQYPFFSVRNYVYIYVCVCVCMHVCMYVCVCMYICMYECVYVCMYVCVYVCELVHVDLTVSTLHKYVRMLTPSG
jgi:hypothetical protein